MGKPQSYNGLSNQDGRLLHCIDEHGLHLEVRQQGDLRWLHFGGHAIQAMMRMDKPEELLLPYNVAMLGALLFAPHPQSLLNLGLGSGSFERFFRARLPHIRVTSVESSAAVIDTAKQFFLIPEKQNIFHQSAEDFLTRHKKKYDLIFCDMFEGDSHPGFMEQAPFYALLARSLREDGAVAINLLPRNDDELLQILLAIRQNFSWVLLMEFPEHRNIVLFLLKHEPEEKEQLTRRAAELSTSLKLELNDIPARMLRLPEKPN